MSGIALEIDVQGLERLQDRLDKLSGFDMVRLLESVGAVVESQTKRRINKEKRGPDGTAWPAWSDEYAKTRHGGHSLLENEGNLRDSIQFVVAGDELEVGSNLVYARTHQLGDKRLAFGSFMATYPARPFLGLSNDNEKEVVSVIEDYLDSLMGSP